MYLMFFVTVLQKIEQHEFAAVRLHQKETDEQGNVSSL